MSKRPIPEVDLAVFKAADDDRKNRLLLDWLSDDARRLDLYRAINASCGSLEFPSRDVATRESEHKGIEHPRTPPVLGHKTVKLVTRRDDITTILEDDGKEYSNRLYAELGGGSFMLALDPKTAMAHAEQRQAFRSCFAHSTNDLVELSHKACQAASITALRAADFDLAAFAEQSALRFCQKLMGYALADYKLLDVALRASYRALVYQVMGRHFVTDPVVIAEGKAAMGKLLARTAALIDAYALNPKAAHHDEEVLKGTVDRDVPQGFIPALRKLGEHRSDLNGEQRAVIALGAAIGSVGNVQAAACMVIKALFRDQTERDRLRESGPDVDSLWANARRLARGEATGRPTRQFDTWKELIQDLLRQNPPIPFLPRLKVNEQGMATLDEDGLLEGEVLLALGGGTLDSGVADDPLIWGMTGEGTHWCAGQALAWPLIVEIVRQVMALPGLAQRLDAQDASVIGLKKRWGFACESYPLTHRRDERVAQASLNVAMRLKSPVRDNADRVREVIRAGAPRIEQALRESRHVHFAWFELIESDSVLVLHTVYDGPFAAYIQDFALKVGDLFDLLFECIEDPPPTPVDKFPNEFVAQIQRYNRAPTMGYFFSAYPGSDVARILRDELARP